MTAPVADSADQRALIAAAQAGDERAFRASSSPTGQRWRCTATGCSARPRRRGPGAGDAAARLARPRPLRAAGAVHTWLYRIATNACLDELERRPRRPEPVQPFPDSRVERRPPPTSTRLRGTRRARAWSSRFLTAIQLLPGRQRAVLILRDVLGWTAPEVAELLDSTVAAVNSALQRARATIDGECRPRDGRRPERAARAAAPLRRRLGARRRRRPRRPAARGRGAADAAAADAVRRRGDRGLLPPALQRRRHRTDHGGAHVRPTGGPA